VSEEFRAWKAQTAQALKSLAERREIVRTLELEELRKLVERADYRELPRVLVKMTSLALLEPELKRHLPSIEDAKRWMVEEREYRLKTIRRYAFHGGTDKVVVDFFRWDMLKSCYEHFTLFEKIGPGAPIFQRRIEGLPAYRAGASMVVVEKEEFLRKYKGKRLVAVFHIACIGEEYFIDELETEELFTGELFTGDPETRRAPRPGSLPLHLSSRKPLRPAGGSGSREKVDRGRPRPRASPDAGGEVGGG